MLDILLRAKQDDELLQNINFRCVFFDTGIEYKATKEHLDYLENKYNIKIERIKSLIPVPLGCKKYGLPFLTKYVSEMIERLQAVNFDFANDGLKSYEELSNKYHKCKTALKFWCNENAITKGFKESNFNINKFLYLKEFMIQNPPDFKISNKCCQGAKKDNADHFIKENPYIQMECLGIRKAEGGIRSVAYKTCFSEKSKKGIAMFRPIFWFTDKDRLLYEQVYNIEHSKCYTDYGFKRTGCACCCYGSNFEEELETIKDKEPILYKAVNNIFGKSYEYTRKYREFKERKKAEEKAKKKIVDGQISIFDYLKESMK